MKKIYGNVVLITGASSGIGEACAALLMNAGYKVYGTSRKPPATNQEISGKNGGFIRMIQLDVCNEDSVKQAVDYVVAKEGTIDILINNAGFGLAGSIEETNPAEAYNEFNTNFFGVHRVSRLVIPIMRRQKKGLIINIGSVAGYITIPFQAMYSATKFALEAFTEALRIELRPFGIKAALVEPGDIKTNFTHNQVMAAAAKLTDTYGERFFRSIEYMAASEQNGPGPQMVAKAVFKLTNKKHPPVRVIVGFIYNLFAVLKRLLPARVTEFIVARVYG
jgi:short-subunit dehydrogenase